MNIGGSSTIAENGELLLLRLMARTVPPGGEATIFDVGANEGDYAAAALDSLGRRVVLYCFEPGSAAFAALRRRLGNRPNVHLFPLALAERNESRMLFGNAPGSVLASLYERRLLGVGLEMKPLETVRTQTLDAFCADEGIDSINLLKLDVEGSELDVLRGAEGLIDRGAVDAIQFEFGGTGVDARIYLRDFFDLLEPRYAICRLVPDGVVEMGYCCRHEIFVYSNYVAVRRDLRPVLLR